MWPSMINIYIGYVDYIIKSLSEYATMKAEGRNTPVVDETFAKFLNAITRASSVPEELDPLTPIGIAYLHF